MRSEFTVLFLGDSQPLHQRHRTSVVRHLQRLIATAVLHQKTYVIVVNIGCVSLKGKAEFFVCQSSPGASYSGECLTILMVCARDLVLGLMKPRKFILRLPPKGYDTFLVCGHFGE